MHDDLRFLIDGEWTAGGSGDGEPVIDPATEEVLGTLPHAGVAELDRAAEAAARGLAVWRESTAEERARVLREAARLIGERKDGLARAMTLEQGKTLTESGLEWDRVIDTLNWTADAAIAVSDTDYPARSASLAQSSRATPVGVVLALTAWNFPAILPVRKIAPALAAGCSVILKAAEETPASAIGLIQALQDAGLPDGVVNLVFGNPDFVSRHLLARREVRKLSFTGSVPVGKHLAGLAAQRLVRGTYELGGHAPAIVTKDADIEGAAQALAAFKFRNAGQVCISPARFFIEKPALEPFLESFLDFAQNIRVGPGLDPNTTMGPMANARRIEAMDRFCADARDRGATVLTGGERDGNKGYFWQPTVLTGLPGDAAAMREETFGPVAPIQAFEDLDAVIAESNALEYGLAAYVFTGSKDTEARLIRALESGSVAVNTVTPAMPDTPFGGVKESGYGYEGGMEGIEAFLTRKLVSVVP